MSEAMEKIAMTQTENEYNESKIALSLACDRRDSAYRNWLYSSQGDSLNNRLVLDEALNNWGKCLKLRNDLYDMWKSENRK